MDLNKLKVQRGAIKGKLTRIINFVDGYSQDRNTTHDLEVRKMELGSMIQRFEDIQLEIEIADMDPEHQPAHELERETFEERYYSTMATLEELTNNSQQQSANLSIEHNSTTVHECNIKKPRVRLPQLELPRFDGDIRQWSTFKNIFYASVDNADLPVVNKMQYLKSALAGEAAGLISSLLITEENYEKALSILSKRYENKSIVVNFHLKAMLIKHNLITKSNLKDFLVILQQSLDSLKSINLPVESWDALLVFLISQKLDNSLRAAWEISRKENTIATLAELLEFLNLRRTAFEMLNDNKTNDNSNVKSSHITSATSNLSCILCQSKHMLSKCPHYLELTIPNRIQLIKAKSLCYNCLQPYVAKHKCSKYKCLKCHGRHHTSIHMDKNQLQVSHTSTTLQDVPQSSQNILPTTATLNEHPQVLLHNNISPQTQKSSTTSQLDCTQSLHNNNSHNNPSTSTVLVSSVNKNQILLSTAIIRIQGPSGKWVNARALLDAGSEVNIATHRLATQLQLKLTDNACLIQGIGNSQKPTQVSANAIISSRYTDYTANLSLIIMDKITVPLPHTYIPTHAWPIPYKHAQTLADPTFYIPSTIDILIGAELFYSIMKSGRMKLGPNLPYLIDTAFGWVVSGPVAMDSSLATLLCAHVSMCDISESSNSTDQLLQSFWEQEEPVSKKKMLSPMDKYCEELFNSTTTQNKLGHFVVNLPIQTHRIKELGNSFNIAYKLLLQLESKMSKDTELSKQYKAFIQEFIDLGHAHDIDNFSPTELNTYYMPHFAVLKPDSVSTKLRTVFNASAKTSSGISLNDIMYEGPNIYNDLFEIIIRFRTYKYAFSCDIVKMFRGIFIDPQQTRLQRILWRDSPNEKLKCIELDTVTYGTKSAPYLACRTMLYLAEKYTKSHKLAANCIKNSSYMDDYLCGEKSKEKLFQLCSELIDLLSKAGFKLHKWTSNHPDLYNYLASIEPSFKNLPSQSSQKDKDIDISSYNFTPPTSVKTLGITWLPAKDTLQVFIPNLTNIPCTKRNILSQIAQIFDPIGLLAPVTILAKILMQEIWRQNTDWDSLVSQEIQTTWQNFINQLHNLINIQIPRYYFSDNSNDIVLIGFCDSSSKAYGACLYLRATYPNKQPTCTLVTAKSKVSPIKKQQSIPRLELCGALLLAQLTNRFIALTKDIITINQIHLFTDSSIVLNWIRSPYKSKHDTYVTHRLMRIIETTQSRDWYYVNTKQNPADLITRGVMPTALQSCTLWWQGPSWLCQDIASWPITQTPPPIEFTQAQPEKSSHQSGVFTASVTPHINYNSFYESLCKHSNFTSLIRSMAYFFRFIHNIKNKNNKLTSYLSISELKNAHDFIIKTCQYNSFSKEIHEIQSIHTNVSQHINTNKVKSYYTFTSSPLKRLNPFLDEFNLLRVGGRIQHSDIPYNQAHPIILPGKDHITSIIVQHYHTKLLHAGIQCTLYNMRLKYWPINGRCEVKKCIHSCVRCIRYQGKVCGQQMASLPAPRVNLTRAFNHVGIDFSGAMSIRNSMTRNCKYSKGYICLFVCLSTRAIHLELVTDMSSQSFICALKRFVSRRGIPTCLYTDNATNFKGSKTELHDLYKMFKNETCYSNILDYASANCIEYKFTIPLASHMGGIYEAGIKSVKSLLKKHLFSTKLTYEFFYTVLTQIESILNSRPLYPLTDLPYDLNCLTPAHFIIGTALTDLPEPNVLDLNESRLNIYQKIIQIKQKFWKQFYCNYLSELQSRNKWLQVQNNLKTGDLIIIKDENTPPTFWPLGRVISTNKNKTDGLVRSAVIRTSKSEYTRPIHKLILLPNKLVLN